MPTKVTSMSARLLLATLLLSGVGVFMGVAAVVAYAHAGRSSTVQHEGIRAQGVVLSTEEHLTHRKYSTTVDYTSWNVRLDQSYDGTAITDVHVPGAASQEPVGTRVTVLLDPSDPTYAELPGRPLWSSSSWMYRAGGALVALVSGALVFLARRRARRLGRIE